MGKNIYANRNTNSANIRNLTAFNGFYTNQYREPLVGGLGFIFITKPMLFIEPIKPVKGQSREDLLANMAYINMTRDPVFSQFLASEALSKEDLLLVKMLSYNEKYTADPDYKSCFLPIFTNECKGFDPNDVNMDSISTFDTKQGYSQPLPTYKTASEAANQLTIPVTEDSNLSFTKMLTLWVNYISNITDGTFDANPNMIKTGTLDYTSSIYYFLLEPDGQTIKYYCRYTGCWPTSIPFGGLKYARGSGEPVEIDTTWQYTVKEDMNPKILEDFNRVSLRLTDYIVDERIVGSMYASTITSPLLNRASMMEIPTAEMILKSEDRDPIILLKDGSSSGVYPDKTKRGFVLLFNDSAYSSPFSDNMFDDGQTYLNDTATNFAPNGQDFGAWSESSFWESIDKDK